MLKKVLKKGSTYTSERFDGVKQKIKVIDMEYRDASEDYDDFISAIQDDKFLGLFGFHNVPDYQMFEEKGYDKKGTLLGKIIKPKQYAKCVSNEIMNVSITPFRDGVEIFRLEVKPEYQGNGIGTAILQRLNRISAKLDIPIYLKPGDLITGNNISQEKRIRFYANEGFIKPKGDKYFNNNDWLDEYYNMTISDRKQLDDIFAERDKLWEKHH